MSSSWWGGNTPWYDALETWFSGSFQMLTNPFKKGIASGIELLVGGAWEFVKTHPWVTGFVSLLGIIGFSTYKRKGFGWSLSHFNFEYSNFLGSVGAHADVGGSPHLTVASMQSQLSTISRQVSTLAASEVETRDALTALHRSVTTKFDNLNTAMGNSFRELNTGLRPIAEGTAELVRHRRSKSLPGGKTS